jgi:hypothetical protein
MLFIVRTNLIILLLFAFSLVHLYLGDNTAWYFSWVELLTFAAVAVIEMILITRMRALYGFSLVLLYALALIHGLKIMLSLGSIESAVDVFVLIFHGFLIVYFIGVRGYLRSDRGRAAMGFAVNEAPKNVP